jgi:hypothetical protein
MMPDVPRMMPNVPGMMPIWGSGDFGVLDFKFLDCGFRILVFGI